MRKFLPVFCFLFASLFTFSQSIYDNYVDGRVYVKLEASLLKKILRQNPRNIPIQHITSIQQVASKYGISRITAPFYQATDDAVLPCILKLEFEKKELVEDLLRDLSKKQGIEYVEKVPLMKVDATTPNDFAISSASVHLMQINAQNAWDIFNGNSNITVAIVDNAVMWTHADLVQNTYTNTAEIAGNNIDDDGNGYVDDRNGYDVTDFDGNTVPTNFGMFHGTHCAGIAAGRTDNGSGIASIGWNLKIIPVKCQTDAGSTSIVANGYEGIIYAVKAKARIISCSWGNSGSSATEQSVINYAWNRGSIIIASAGNNNSSAPNFPGAYTNVYCVAAVSPSDVKWNLSSYGSWVDISAPGENIYSSMPYTGTPFYQAQSGTSMATPMVAGLAGLMLSKSPNMTRTNVLNCISSTAVNIYTLAGNSAFVSGNLLGAGRIEAFQAMTCAATFSALPPLANFYAFPLYTCPNTPVSFVDSSLYAPTSWNWVFQGGTPATSTLTNPTVLWTSPGTYSVSLTVANGSGSNTATKVSYVTVAGPLSLPFFEGFQATTFLPVNWSPNNIQNDNIFWARNTNLGGFGTSSACSWFDNFTLNAPGERDEMRSPKFDFNNVVTARLRFDVAYARYDAWFSDSLEVKLSTNCGSTWTSIYLKGGTGLSTAPDASSFFVPGNSQWRRDSIDISVLTAGQGNVMFSFINRGHFGQPIYLDNINLTFPTPSVVVNQPTSVCVGAVTYTFASIIGASSHTWNFQGGSPASSTLASPVISYTSPGTFTYSVEGVNGTSTVSSTRTLTVLAYPALAVTGSTICSGNTASISASGASAYLWLNGTSTLGTGSGIVVTPTSTTIYSVSGFNGNCSDTETVQVTVSPSTVVVTVTSSSTLLCSGDSSTLNVSGATTYSWSTGAGGSSIVITPSATTSYTVSGLTNGCGGSAVTTISVLPIPQTSVITTNALCYGNCNGSLVISGSSGAGPFSYQLSGSNCTVFPCQNLCMGVYSLTTTGAGNCQETQVISISEPPLLQSVISSTSNATCPGCSDGSLSATVNGGSAPYTFSWSPAGGNSLTTSGVPAGCYTITITDANGCNSSASACVDAFTGMQETARAKGFRIFPNPSKEKLSVEWLGKTFEFSLYDYLGRTLIDRHTASGTYTFDLSSYANGVYLIKIEGGGQIAWVKLVVE